MSRAGGSTIELAFADGRLERACASGKALERRFGALAPTLARRLSSLRYAPVLSDLRTVPGRFEQLRGDRRGQFSMRLDGNMRIIFEVAGEVPLLENGEIELQRVTKVRILEVADYHGR